MSDRVDRDVINALIAGHFADPFSVLGMHRTEAGLEVRALLPDATEVWVIEPKTGRKVGNLECLDSRGFFSGVMPRRKNPFRYQLAVLWHGQQNLIDDPYSFGPLLKEMDAWLLSEGTHLRPYETLGAHADTMDGITGTRFSVWAPNAQRVSVVGQFNYWDGRRHPMRLRRETGIWELFIPGAHHGQLYKFEMIDAHGKLRIKADPYAFEAQMRPDTASLICGLPEKVVQTEERKQANRFDAPISVYEVHLGSWRRHTDNNFWLSYRELADQLVPYAKWMGFTHLELLPVNEHPFDGSWGYQPTGLYAPTRRFGTRDDFRYFIDAAHAAGLNVILDWVPGHFPMIYRDYSRKEGEWIPNEYGGRENLEAIEFLRNTNRIIGEQVDGAVTMAEESTDFAGVSRPPSSGGLGFWYKWNLGWMHDTLDYMKLDPVHRKYHHDKLTFGILYNYTENFMLPLSHDEVVHGKKSILDRMPGDAWQKFANLRASIRTALSGWWWTTTSARYLSSCGATERVTRSSSPATSRRCRASTTASALTSRASGAKSSIPTRCTTTAATPVTAGWYRATPSKATGGQTP